MKFKTEKKMKIKLNSKDVLEITKAIKSGWLDVDKVERFRYLLNGYNPPKEITRKQMDYYRECLYMGWGYTPTDEAEIKSMMLECLPMDLKEKWQKSVEDGSVYKKLVRDAYLGMVAMRALGGKFTQKDADYSFCEKKLTFEI